MYCHQVHITWLCTWKSVFTSTVAPTCSTSCTVQGIFGRNNIIFILVFMNITNLKGLKITNLMLCKSSGLKLKI